MNTKFWNCKMFCVVTGASRGLGRSIAIHFSKHATAGSVFLLLARNQQGLEETRLQMLAYNDGINVITEVVDLSQLDADRYHQILINSLQDKSTDFDRSIMVHNAGSLGDLTKNGQSFVDKNELRSYFDLNLNSVIMLTAAFLRNFKVNILVVNISSLAALQSFKGFHLYCTGKAARDAYFRVLAEEENISVLSYAPGPLDTDMISEILSTAAQEHKEWFTKAKREGTLLTCDSTVTRLMTIIESGKYKSGDHIDYYDKL